MAEDIKGREHLVARQVAMTNVFKKFAPIWKQAFHSNQWANLLEPWMDACHGIDTSVLEPAAKALLKTKPTYPPKPWDFADVARQLHYENSPRMERQSAAKTSDPYRFWEWLDPISRRIARVEVRNGAWVVMAVGEYQKFMEMDDHSKTAYAGAMELEHGWHKRGAA